MTVTVDPTRRTPGRAGTPAADTDTATNDTARKNTAVALRVHANAMPAGTQSVLRRLLAPDFRNHDVLPGCSGGPEALAATMRWFHVAFSDQRVEVLQAVTEDDLVALHVAFSGRHTGFFRGLAPTRRRFTVREMHMVRLCGGLEAEHWVVRDEAWLERELHR